MGKAFAFARQNSVVRILETPILAQKSFQFPSLYAKMGTAKPACPQSGLEKALQFSRLWVVQVRFEADRSIRILGI
ncbi:hypothetical protein, partial [Oscillibacter sp. UBA6647]|uniref:hypothetical protein n=1 Tax=Oscillibacter sp. UBA6647 TaxID=1947021 RepID=UPI0025F697D8